MNILEFAQTIDQTNLNPVTGFNEFQKFCQEAADYHFASVAMLPLYIKTASTVLKSTDTKVCAAISYPLSSVPAELKAAETRDALIKGANEIDYVINVGAIKSGEYDLLVDEARQVIAAADGRVVKAIIEMWVLTEDEIRAACESCCEAGVTFVKSSTGFPGYKAMRGSTEDDARLLLKYVVNPVKVKIAGGIKDANFALKLLNMGVSRLGTSSGVKILREYKQIYNQSLISTKI